LEYATKQGADLHLCPKSAPFVRLGGKSSSLKPISEFEDSPLDVATVKAIVGELLTPEQKSELQKNKYVDVSFTYGELGRFRAYAYTQRGTHAITIHTLPFEVPDIYNMELPDNMIAEIESIITNPNGLIVIAVNYFSSASAILAALVDLANQWRNCHISTIEKPIEYLHSHKSAVVIQKEIGADVADFKTALEQVRHENPDIVVISELRQADFLPVMELAEERLVIAALRINALHTNADEIVAALRKAIQSKACVFPPNPKITIIGQQDNEISVFDNS